MKILVTGASGFAGSHLVEYLLSETRFQADMIYGTYMGSSSFLTSLLPKDQCICIDLTHEQEVDACIRTIQPDWIFHLAAFAAVGKSYEEIPKVLQNNIMVQAYMLEAMRKHAPKARMLSVGSAEEYGGSRQESGILAEDHPLMPVNAYGVSKVSQDLLAYAYTKSFGLDIVRVRPFNHIGVRQSVNFVVPSFVSQLSSIKRGAPPILRVGNIQTIRDFSDVKDIVKGYVVLMEKGKSGEVYNLGSEKGVSIEEILRMIISFSGLKVTIQQDPSKMRPADIRVMICDATKAKQLGWKPTHSLQSVLQEIVDEALHQNNGENI